MFYCKCHLYGAFLFLPIYMGKINSIIKHIGVKGRSSLAKRSSDAIVSLLALSEERQNKNISPSSFENIFYIKDRKPKNQKERGVNMKNYKEEIAKKLIRNMKKGYVSIKPNTVEKKYNGYDLELTKDINKAIKEMWEIGLVEVEIDQDLDMITKIKVARGKQKDIFRFYIEESNKKGVRKRK